MDTPWRERAKLWENLLETGEHTEVRLWEPREAPAQARGGGNLERGRLILEIEEDRKGRPRISGRVQCNGEELTFGKALRIRLQATLSNGIQDYVEANHGRLCVFVRDGGEVAGFECVPEEVAAESALQIPLAVPCPGHAMGSSEEQTAFHNPYAFVSPVERNDGDKVWGRRKPVPHDRLDPGQHTGEITLQLTTLTPYFSVKPGVHTEGDRKREPRKDIPATTLKGAVRAMYETLTNSCFGVFSDDNARAPYRLPPGEAPRNLTAVRIIEDEEGELKAEEMSEIRILAYGPETCPAAYFPYPRLDLGDLRDGERIWYRRAPVEVVAVGAPENIMKLRSDETAAASEAFFEGPKPLTPQQKNLFPGGEESIRLGKVERLEEPISGEVTLPVGTLGVRDNKNSFIPFRRDGEGKIRPVKAREMKVNTPVWFATRVLSTVEGIVRAGAGSPPDGYREGFLRRVNKTVTAKVFESVFTVTRSAKRFSITEEATELYEQLIEETQRLNHKVQDGTLPSLFVTDQTRRQLHEGLLLYADLAGDKAQKFYTVKLGRALHKATLRNALARHHLEEKYPDPETDGPYNHPGSLLPCRHGRWLCPACRLFGWVGQRGVALEDLDGTPVPSSYRGRLRFEATDMGRIESFNTGLPLAVLSCPKVNRASFYLSHKDDGQPHWEDEKSRVAGRKFYWKHHLSEDYWDYRLEANSSTHPFRREDDLSDEQNWVLTGWVPPGVKFKTRIRFENLSSEELGALLSCLELPEGCALRLGAGKPLGLGAFESRVTALRLLKVRESYQTLGPLQWRTPDKEEVEGWIQGFAGTLFQAYRDKAEPGEEARLDRLPFVADLFRILAGPEPRAQVHYPRKTTVDPEQPKLGSHIPWFTTHEHKKLPKPRDAKVLRREYTHRSRS